MKTYYTIYQITNKINGKTYIGSHKTKNLEDGYMGSGKYLKYAQEKHGIDNFEKEILFVFEDPELMYAKEAELVDEDFIAEANTYNLKVGGYGGWDFVNDNLTTEHLSKRAKLGRIATNKRLEEKYGKDWKKVISQLGSEKLKSLMQEDSNWSSNNLGRVMSGPDNPMFGKTHTAEARQKISESSRGENNSQFGKRWIYSEAEKRSMKIGKHDPLPNGWNEGRKLKF